MNLIPRPIGLVCAVLATAAVVVVACGGGDDASPTPTPSGDGDLASAGPGTFIFEGERFEPPFDVTANGREVSVNGTTILTLGGIEPEAPDLDAPIESAFQLADHAAAAYEDAGAGPGALQAAADAIADEPVFASAVVDEAAGELAITDTDGLEVFFIPDPPENAVRSRSDSELESDASALADEWSELLDGGGLILVPSEGPTLAMAGTAAAEMVAQIDEAMGLDGSEREQRLLELLTHKEIVAELIDRYEPAEARRMPSDGGGRYALAASDATEAGQTTSISYARTDRGASAGGPAQAAGGMSQTPGKPEAYIFTTLPADSDARPFFDVVKSEGYQVWVYQAEHRAFGGRGWENFLSTSGTGALYLATHGDPRGVSIESFASERAAGAVQARLRGPEAGNYYWWRERDGTWWLAISIQGLQRHWQSNNTIVHAAICNSNTLNAGFRAREYFAYQPTTSCAVAAPDTTLLWQRMSGEQGEGAFRPASVAFAQGGFSAGFRFDDGSPDGDTVVSPGVKSLSSLELQVGESDFVTIQFDAFLDATVPSQALPRVTGCIQPAGEPSYEWDAQHFALIVPVTATTVGSGGVTVIAGQTRSPGRIHLDGNQNPVGSNHVAENRDDYVGGVTCVSALAPPTETTGIDPSATAEPSASAEPSGTPDPTEPPPTETPEAESGAEPTTMDATVPTGKIRVFYLGGVFYDASGLYVVGAHEPYCYYTHVHGEPIAPVLPAGGQPASEHLGECGFGPPNFYLIDAP